MTGAEKNLRAVFPAGEQKTFLAKVASTLGTKKMSEICSYSERTIRDWRREKFHMMLGAVHSLSEAAHIDPPTDFVTRDAYAHASEAGKKGGRAIVEKYGGIPVSEEYRQKQWQKWWESTGQFKQWQSSQPKPISVPEFSSELAEFFGIMMGDGGLTHNQATISLHHIDDLEYSYFITELIEKLFSVTPSVYHHEYHSVNNIVVSRVALVNFLHSHGLPIGDKVRQHLDIPDWIKDNPEYSIACVRGLIDTDGCIFTHSYLSRGHRYTYKKIDFTSASERLLESVWNIFHTFGMKPRLTNHRNVRLESIADVSRYFDVIGSHNPKHLNRYAS